MLEYISGLDSFGNKDRVDAQAAGDFSSGFNAPKREMRSAQLGGGNFLQRVNRRRMFWAGWLGWWVFSGLAEARQTRGRIHVST